jgi:hypothetical protein
VREKETEKKVKKIERGDKKETEDVRERDQRTREERKKGGRKK